MLEFKGDTSNPDKKRNHLTRRGQMVAAIRRNLTNTSAKDLGIACLADMGTNAVTRAEHLLGASRVASFRQFHLDMEQEFHHELQIAQHDPDNMRFVVHSFSEGLTGQARCC
jgi:hypothetical protein